MHASQRLPRGRRSHLVRRLLLLAGIDLRRCLCARCIAARSGLFRRTRSRVGRQVYADVHLLGIRTSHRFAFEMPMMTAPSLSAGAALDAAGHTASTSDRDSGSLPLAPVNFGAHL